MNLSDLYKQILQKKIAQQTGTQPQLTQETPSGGFKGYSDRNSGNVYGQVFNDYMNPAQDAQDTQKMGASVTDSAGKVLDGFAKGGPVGAIVAAAKVARAAGKNASNNTKALGKQGMENAQQESQNLINEPSPAENNQEVLNNIVANSTAGNITGGAAPIQQPQLTPLEDYQNSLRQQGYSDDVINGVSQGLNSGYKEIDDWIKQYNAGSGRNNPINIPQTEEEIAAARSGKFNIPAQTASTEENIKNGLMDKFISGIGDFTRGYQENRNTGFKPENLQRDDNKSKMNRIGEVFGTIGRVAQNPAVQAALATGISAAMGNPFALAQGYKFGNRRAMSNVYENALKNQGIDVPNAGLFGDYDSRDFNALIMPKYKEIMADLAKAKLLEQQNYHNQMIENQKQLNEIRQQNADTNKQKAENQKNKPVKTTKSGGSSSKYQLVNGKDGKVYKLNKATGEYQVVGSQGSGGVGSTGNSIVTANNTPQTEEDFKNRVFKNKKNNSNDKGWAF